MPQLASSPNGMTTSRSCSSPAVSEISVGSPSPPPSVRSANVKRLRTQRSPVKTSQPGEGIRIKSFSIADILGRGHDEDERPAATAATPAPSTVLLQERLQGPAAVPLLHCPPGLHPFLSPALLHSYEQRLAWDYQRQLQEHFQAQAQLLRQMSMDPAIIPSEDGSSERSQRSSSSNGSTDYCSPTQPEKQPPPVVVSNATNSQKKPEAGADTPLDALFQLSTKNFDEEQGARALSDSSDYDQQSHHHNH